jgi:SAM-dependent methyltransferase
MDAEAEPSTEDRLRQLLRHLGIDQAHFAGYPADWPRLAARYPEVFSSFTVIAAPSFDPRAVEPLAAKSLVITGDRGRAAEATLGGMDRLPGAELVTLSDYEIQGWSDVAAERADELGGAMLEFLARRTVPAPTRIVSLRQGEGEIAGIRYRIRGAGPPLMLLPMFLAPSQWEPLVPRLSERYCTITLGGAALGAVAILESRGRSIGYLHMVRTLLELRPGEAVLEVGCGSGVLTRWLAGRSAGAHRITGVDINPYLLREARALARRDGLEGAIEFRQGNAESLPFADNSFDVTMSVTVIEEVDADRMLAEMVRVTKPGGRVAVVARAIDMPALVNAPLAAGLKARVEAPGGGVADKGCADASLYRRTHQTGLTQVKMLPQLAVFDRSEPTMLAFMQGRFVPQLRPEEAKEWWTAREQAEAEGTFFMTWPHHCAVGTKAL